MKASELFVKCLENESVEYIFGIPGEENLDLMDSLLSSDIKFIQTRHEQGAAFMADVYGRLSGRAGVCLATLGPGALNLVTPVADAQLDNAPLVAITGQSPLNVMHKESHQYVDIVGLFRRITKWNTQIKSENTISETVRKAFKIAQTEKPGSTHLELPEDIASAQVEDIPLIWQQPKPTEPNKNQVERAAQVISNAEYPLILAGNGVVRSGSADALLEFATKLQIPVTETFMGKGSIPNSNPLSLFAVGFKAKDYISCGLDHADVIITVGYDMVEYAPIQWNKNKDKKIVHIHSSPAEVDSAYQVEVGVQGHMAFSLNAIAEIAEPSKLPVPDPHREVMLNEMHEYDDDDGFPIKPQKIISDVRKALRADDILISDVGAHKMWIARMYPCDQPNTAIISNGLASMGIALPGAIAAKLLFPEKNIIAISGDGGFMMNSQEIETALRIGTPFVNLIFNDGKYGLIEWQQNVQFGRESHVDFTNPDFVRYAESFGAKAYRVGAANELLPILEEALRQDVVSIVDCPVDYSENIKLTESLKEITCPL
ncbi:MAG: acetolactate synthase large subunit [Candidatus Marinimicrobia bacterium]|nr:acetolactate synthase large subunit [Candidatus Neomarinimicrobiota bacterium]